MLKRIETLAPEASAGSQPDIRGWRVTDRDGRSLGTVESVLMDTDEEGARSRYLAIRAGDRVKTVPIGMAVIDDGSERIELSEADLDRLPETEDEVTETGEQRLYATFFPQDREVDYDRPEFRSDSQKLLLMEEKLRVGKRTEPVGEAVARKIVEEHPARETVQLRQEEATVERRPVGKPLSETEYAHEKPFEGSQEIKVPIVAEKAVVQKEPFVKEEVVLKKEAHLEPETIEETVRSENVEISGARTAESPSGEISRPTGAQLRPPAPQIRREPATGNVETETVEEHRPSMMDKIKKTLGME